MNHNRGGEVEGGRFLYQQLAEELRTAVRQGLYPVGSRLPSLRRLCSQHGVSLATAVQALRSLEEAGEVEARARSGYFVRPAPGPSKHEPAVSRPRMRPREVGTAQLALEMLAEARAPGLLRLGAAVPGAELLPLGALSRALAGVARRHPETAALYEPAEGNAALRRQVARHLRRAGIRCRPDEVLITNGCMEALTLSLRALTRPGDAVAIESPSYYGLLQAIAALGLHAVEVPTDPRHGVELDALERLLARGVVRACLFMPGFHNPLGASMPEAAKRRLVAMTAAAGVPLVEDDVFGDLAFQQPRPAAAKAFDDAGEVVYCASFSKSLAPGYRIGYMLPGRHFETVRHLKMLGNITTAGPLQLALAEFLARGGYPRILDRAVAVYRARVEALRQAVLEHFPTGTRVTRPRGGFVLWLQLPPGVDSVALYRAGLEAGIAVTPGLIFFPRGDDRRHLRLSCGQVESDEGGEAVQRLGALARAMSTA